MRIARRRNPEIAATDPATIRATQTLNLDPVSNLLRTPSPILATPPKSRPPVAGAAVTDPATPPPRPRQARPDLDAGPSRESARTRTAPPAVNNVRTRDAVDSDELAVTCSGILSLIPRSCRIDRSCRIEL